MRVIDCIDLKCYQKEAIAFLKTRIELFRKSNKKITISLPGGRSVVPILDALLKSVDLNLKDVHFFSLDERLVPVIDNLSNNFFLHDLFFNPMISKGLISKDQIHLYDPTLPLASYSQQLKQFGGSFDISIIGVGEDGHIAALFPSHESFYLSEGPYVEFHNSPKFPPKRMSATKETIVNSKSALVLFWGDEKKWAYQRFLEASTSDSELPVNIVRQITDSVVLTCFKQGKENGTN